MTAIILWLVLHLPFFHRHPHTQPALSYDRVALVKYLVRAQDILDEAQQKRPDLYESQIAPAQVVLYQIVLADPSDTHIPDMVDDLHSRLIFILDQEDMTTI